MATNYGLLNNIATGLREGLVTYQTISNMKNQQRQNELLMKMQMQEKGLIQAQDPATGETVLQRDPEFMRRQLQNKISEAATEGKVLELNPEGTGLVFKGYSPEFVSAQREIYGAKNPFAFVSPGQKAAEMTFVKDSAKKLSDTMNIKDSIDGVLSTLTDPNIPYEQKLTAAKGSLKLINSALINSPDAVGAEEAQRLSQFIEPSIKNVLPGQAGPLIKPDVNSFTEQLRLVSENMGSKIMNLQQRSGIGGKGLIKSLDKSGAIQQSKEPKVGDVVDGYEFLGGDPANEKSWRKK